LGEGRCGADGKDQASAPARYLIFHTVLHHGLKI
jgi:hypothetical protein